MEAMPNERRNPRRPPPEIAASHLSLRLERSGREIWFEVIRAEAQRRRERCSLANGLRAFGIEDIGAFD